jgi:hypothetical protein
VKPERINNKKGRNVALFLCNAFEGLIRKPQPKGFDRRDSLWVDMKEEKQDACVHGRRDQEEG